MTNAIYMSMHARVRLEDPLGFPASRLGKGACMLSGGSFFEGAKTMLKSPTELHIIDFAKETEIQELIQTLRLCAPSAYVIVLNQRVQQRFHQRQQPNHTQSEYRALHIRSIY